jgi:hypothetical protein
MLGSGRNNYSSIELPLDGSVQRSNAGFLAPLQTKIAINIDGVATGSTVTIPLPTPPAGKAWYITDMSLTHDQTSGQSFAIKAGGVTKWSTNCHGSLAPDLIPGMETQIDIQGGVAPTLVIAGTGSMHSWFNAAGVQQAIGGG